VTVDGTPFPVAVVGPSPDARSGLDLEPCARTVSLEQGSHTVRTTAGLGTGFDVDRVVLSSDRAGKPAPVTPAGAPIRESGARVRVTSSNADSYHLRVRTDGSPFWLVLGQSHNDGWEATVDGHSLGSPQLVNGFANGWTVRPGQAGTLDVVLRWTPQRSVWIGLVVSVVAVLGCLALVFVRRRSVASVRGPELFDEPVATSPLRYDGVAPPLGAMLGAVAITAIATVLMSRWWIGLFVGLAVLVAPRLTRGRLLFAAGAPVALALGALFDVPELGWVALGLLVGDLVTDWWLRRRQRG
jgi:arabinofuranan 3-O-arabinosyltransferase